MALFAVHYTYDQRTALRDQYRPAHRGYLRELFADGILLTVGSYPDATRPGALLIFKANTAEDVAGRLRSDPFVAQGLVTNADIREWNVAYGPWA